MPVKHRSLYVCFVLTSLGTDAIIKELIPGALRGLTVSQTAVLGHSLGGATAADAMMRDKRIIASVNMDGRLYGKVIKEGVKGLHLAITDDQHTPDPTWQSMFRETEGWVRGLEIHGFQHGSYTDEPLLASMAGIEDGSALGLGFLDGQRTVDITIKLLVSFLGYVFTGDEQDILRGTDVAYPEVKILKNV